MWEEGALLLEFCIITPTLEWFSNDKTEHNIWPFLYGKYFTLPFNFTWTDNYIQLISISISIRTL